jgi:hypothetical protein
MTDRDNYCTLEAAQRLEKARIVLETEKCWILTYVADVWVIVNKNESSGYGACIPAPSMTEVWRELYKYLEDFQLQGKVWTELIRSPNPTDALVELLIWLTAQKEG